MDEVLNQCVVLTQHPWLYQAPMPRNHSKALWSPKPSIKNDWPACAEQVSRNDWQWVQFLPGVYNLRLPKTSYRDELTPSYCAVHSKDIEGPGCGTVGTTPSDCIICLTPAFLCICVWMLVLCHSFSQVPGSNHAGWSM